VVDRSKRYVCMWVLSLLLAACAEGESARPDYASGLDDTERTVADLDDPELSQICETYDVYVDTYVSFEAIAYVACLPGALVLSNDVDSCERRLGACMDLFPEPIEVKARVETQEVCFDDLRQCEASVAQLEGCVNVNLDRLLEISQWSCELFDDSETRAQARQMQDTVAVCSELGPACNRFATSIGPD
jgi:hypothetical protein